MGHLSGGERTWARIVTHLIVIGDYDLSSLCVV